MHRIEVNVTSGQRTEIPLTHEEIAAAEIRSATEAQQRALEQAAVAREEKRAAAITALLAEAAKDPAAPAAVKDYAALRQ